MKTKRKKLGKYIVADPSICHGKPTFVNTRIMVAQVLGQVAKGMACMACMAWDDIQAEWRGRVTKEAIAEAVDLANKALGKSTKDLRNAKKPLAISWKV